MDTFPPDDAMPIEEDGSEPEPAVTEDVKKAIDKRLGKDVDRDSLSANTEKQDINERLGTDIRSSYHPDQQA